MRRIHRGVLAALLTASLAGVACETTIDADPDGGPTPTDVETTDTPEDEDTPETPEDEETSGDNSGSNGGDGGDGGSGEG